MSMPVITHCPGTLVEGFSSYSPACLRLMFANKKVSPQLAFSSPQVDDEVVAMFMENRKHLSISGMQEKISLIQIGRELRCAKEFEQGTHILKPIPTSLKKSSMIPANEHVTMQIAKQVYGIRTAECALIFFYDGTPAYITKRFDVKESGGKWLTEDCATLAGKTKAEGGDTFKYSYSYEEIGALIRTYIPAWRVEMPRFFAQVVFNYVFSNGDAHLKNFSLMEQAQGDYMLSPAYDLIATRLHVEDSDFALDKGLFADEWKSEPYKKRRHPVTEDFMEFGKRIGLSERQVQRTLEPFIQRQAKVQTLVEHSFLNDATKRAYILLYNTKRNFLSTK